MDIVATYIIKSIIVTGIFYLYYQMALKNKKFHSYNRFYLLLTIIAGVSIPLINFYWFSIETSPGILLNHFTNQVNPAEENYPDNLFTSISLLFATSALISILLLISLALKINWVYRIKKENRNTKRQGFTLIETNVKEAPFSFLNNLFWKQGLSITDPNGEKIFKHELTHITQKHTYDKLLAQIIACIFWMNPFYWLIQKELNTIHEFIADSTAVSDGDTESFAKMLLYSHNEGNYLTPLHSFFNSSLKRRLIMVTSSKPTSYSYLRRILALPVIMIVIAALSTKINAQANTQPANQDQHSFVDTVPKNQESITVVGFRTKKKSAKETNPVASKQSVEPVTVTGYKSKKKTKEKDKKAF